MSIAIWLEIREKCSGNHHYSQNETGDTNPYPILKLRNPDKVI